MSLNLHDGMLAGDHDLPCPGALLIHVDRHNPVRGCLITAHDVLYCEDGTRRLMAGHPISRELAHSVGLTLLGGAATRSLLPASVVMWDGLRLAWWTPSRRRRIWFSLDRPALRDVSRQEVTHPALFWVAEAGRLHLWALASDARPEAGTPLYQAPYLNIYPDGWVCPDTLNWPALRPDAIDDWERHFHDSAGTKVWAERLTLFPGGHDALWRAMGTAGRFPADSLVPAQFTVLDAINQERRALYTEAPPAEAIVPGAAITAGGPRHAEPAAALAGVS